ncbi:MAG: hypothetical protein J5849_01120 [Clostridia bacterium]|nr:hypothetical protein [Clostridia bacterium]
MDACHARVFSRTDRKDLCKRAAQGIKRGDMRGQLHDHGAAFLILLQDRILFGFIGGGFPHIPGRREKKTIPVDDLSIKSDGFFGALGRKCDILRLTVKAVIKEAELLVKGSYPLHSFRRQRTEERSGFSVDGEHLDLTAEIRKEIELFRTVRGGEEQKLGYVRYVLAVREFFREFPTNTGDKIGCPVEKIPVRGIGNVTDYMRHRKVV